MESENEALLEVPEVEVVLRIAGSDVVLVAFFRTQDGWGIDVAMGIDEESRGIAYAETLEHAARLLRTASGKWIPSLPSGELPF